MKTRTKGNLIALFLCSIALSSVIAVRLASDSPYTGSVNDVQPPFSEANYIIGQYNSTYYYARNSSTGRNDFLGMNATWVILSAWAQINVGWFPGSLEQTSGGEIYLTKGWYNITAPLKLWGDRCSFICSIGSTIFAVTPMPYIVSLEGGHNNFEFAQLNGLGFARNIIVDHGLQYSTVKALSITGFSQDGYYVDTENLQQNSLQNFVYINGIISNIPNAAWCFYISSPNSTNLFVQGNEYHLSFLQASANMSQGFLMRIGTSGTANSTSDLINYNMLWINIEANGHAASCLSIASSYNFYQIGFIGGQTGNSWLTFELGTHGNIVSISQSSAAIVGYDPANNNLVLGHG